ncbi:hypothetical protein DL771_012396 [Monosporascus sp. 5C6A]|nr:hypothetical protein DL771_012396 [Monosporascus sp. 5C6A]
MWFSINCLLLQLDVSSVSGSPRVSSDSWELRNSPAAFGRYIKTQNSGRSSLSTTDYESISDGCESDIVPPLEPDDPFRRVLAAVTTEVRLAFSIWRQCPGSGGTSRTGHFNIPTISQTSHHFTSTQPGAPDASLSRSQAQSLDGVASSGSLSGEPKRLFACPFWKRDQTQHPTCIHRVLRDVRAVKQHLRRRHKDNTPYRCMRCWQKFQTYEDHAAHHQDPNCVRSPRPDFNTIFEDQIAEMSRRSDWYTVWDIVFPGRPRPSSPHVDLSVSIDLLTFHEYTQSPEGIERIVSAIQTHDTRDVGMEERSIQLTWVIQAVQQQIFDDWLAQRSAQGILSSVGQNTTAANASIDPGMRIAVGGSAISSQSTLQSADGNGHEIPLHGAAAHLSAANQTALVVDYDDLVPLNHVDIPYGVDVRMQDENWDTRYDAMWDSMVNEDVEDPEKRVRGDGI